MKITLFGINPPTLPRKKGFGEDNVFKPMPMLKTNVKGAKVHINTLQRIDAKTTGVFDNYAVHSFVLSHYFIYGSLLSTSTYSFFKSKSNAM